MKIWTYLFAYILAAFCASNASAALVCKKNGTIVRDEVNIDTTIAVPRSLPKGTKLWTSPEYEASISCWRDFAPEGGEYVHVYINPLDPSNTSLGSDLEVGLRLNGNDIYCSQLTNCSIRLDTYIDGCEWSAGCSDKTRKTFILKYNLFVAKKSPPAPNREGPLTGVDSHPSFQIDGKGGLNQFTSNYRLTIKGLNKLRYIACTSTLAISPKTIDFGTFTSNAAKNGKIIKEVPFSITANKNCNSVYGLNAIMSPVQATLDQETLIPNDNKSVAIDLLNAENSSPLAFNTEFVLVKPSADQVSVNNFIARLRWNTDQPTLGQFNAGATMNIYYK